jgi:hypothetical protein
VPPVERNDRRGEGIGEEPNYMTARKPGPLKIIRYSLNGTYHTQGHLVLS